MYSFFTFKGWLFVYTICSLLWKISRVKILCIDCYIIIKFFVGTYASEMGKMTIERKQFVSEVNYLEIGISTKNSTSMEIV